MNWKVMDDFNYFFESIFAISLVVNEEFKEKLMKICKDDKQITQRFAPEKEIMEYIEANLETDNENLQFLFKLDGAYDVERMSEPLWNIFTYCFDEDGNMRIEKFACFVDYFNDEKEIHSQDELFQYIMSKKISNDMKSKLIFLYLNFDELFDFFRQTIDKVEKLLRKKIHLIRGAMESSIADMRKGFEELGAEGYFSELNLPVNLPKDRDFVIYPRFTISNSMDFRFQGCYRNYVMFWGINLAWMIRYKGNSEFSKENLLNALKTITEKTKFEILLMLGKERMYGSQIAKRIGITTATVSHHVAQMVSLGLIIVGKEQNKVYYQLNRDVISDFIEDLRHKLLNNPESTHSVNQ